MCYDEAEVRKLEEYQNNQEPLDSTQLSEPTEEKAPFVPSPKWKRVFAWVLFAIVILAVINWLLGIAIKDWPGAAVDWIKGFL